jgi:hypothetical protein
MPRHLAYANSLVLVALSSHPAGAQTAPPAKACTGPEYHQFDFWIGEWDVMLPNGKRAGVNRIEPILGGCALRESWSGAGGSRGTSYNAWDATRRRWHQTWVDNQGTLLVIEGAFADGRMVLQGETVDTAGGKQLQRIHLGAVRAWTGAPALGKLGRRRVHLDDGLRWTVHEALRAPASGRLCMGRRAVPFQEYRRHPYRGRSPSWSCPRSLFAYAPLWVTAT